jgi:hypothetical protein
MLLNPVQNHKVYRINLFKHLCILPLLFLSGSFFLCFTNYLSVMEIIPFYESFLPCFEFFHASGIFSVSGIPLSVFFIGTVRRSARSCLNQFRVMNIPCLCKQFHSCRDNR